MPPPLRILLVGLAGVALLVPATGAAAVQGAPPVTTPVETAPPPSELPPPEEPVEPPGADTITLQVPPLPDPVVTAPKQAAARPRAATSKAAPARVRRASARAPRVAERETGRRVDVAPVVEQKQAPKAKPQPKVKPPQRRLTAPLLAPQRPTRERLPARGVLAAQFSAPDVDAPASSQAAVLYLALALAAVLGLLLGLVGAAPLLAGRWPVVFVPVIDATERIVLAGVCLAGAALTLAITWALTGPGA